MSSCRFYKEGTCKLAEMFVRLPDIKTNPSLCEACTKDETPQTINRPVLSLVLSTLISRNLYDPKQHNKIVRALEVPIVYNPNGPGTVIGKVFGWFARSLEAECDCHNWIKIYNLWGRERCFKEIMVIVDTLVESAITHRKMWIQYKAVRVVLKPIIRYIVYKCIQYSKDLPTNHDR